MCIKMVEGYFFENSSDYYYYYYYFYYNFQLLSLLIILIAVLCLFISLEYFHLNIQMMIAFYVGLSLVCQ